jgi:hypothetical protein
MSKTNPEIANDLKSFEKQNPNTRQRAEQIYRMTLQINLDKVRAGTVTEPNTGSNHEAF